MLEKGNDRLREEREQLQEDKVVERERLEALATALKEVTSETMIQKVASLKGELGDRHV